MIPPSVICQIRRMLAEGDVSQRRIAKITGISRATIGAIANGKRPDYHERRSDELEFIRPMGPPVRCGGCGGLVWMPCRLCHIRALKQKEWEELRSRRMSKLRRSA